jgi:hypothetical protein
VNAEQQPRVLQASCHAKFASPCIDKSLHCIPPPVLFLCCRRGIRSRQAGGRGCHRGWQGDAVWRRRRRCGLPLGASLCSCINFSPCGYLCTCA